MGMGHFLQDELLFPDLWMIPSWEATGLGKGVSNCLKQTPISHAFLNYGYRPVVFRALNYTVLCFLTR